MGQNNVIPNFANQNLFKVQQGESFTVPTRVTAPSPANASSGVSPVTAFDSMRDCVGGALYAAAGDAAGPTSQDFQRSINPGDVIALAAVSGGASVVSVNGVAVFSIPTTTHALVLGFYS